MTNSNHNFLDAESVTQLLTDTDPWLSCDDCFDGHDAVIEELLTTGVPISEKFRVHLLGCAACLDEARSLASLIAPELGLTSDAALGRLEQALMISS